MKENPAIFTNFPTALILRKKYTILIGTQAFSTFDKAKARKMARSLIASGVYDMTLKTEEVRE